MICLAVSIGTAKPMPTLPLLPLPPVAICELMPITLPVASMSGPPELPGLIGASVCSTSSISKLLGAWIVRWTAEIDAGGERALEAEGVADGDGRIADLHALRRSRASAARA